MNVLFLLCILFSIISFTLSLKLKLLKKKIILKPSLSDVKIPELFTDDSEELSKAAIERIKKRVDVLLSVDSCKPSAKYILYAAGGVDGFEDLKELKLTNNTEDDLENIEDLLEDNKIIEIEVFRNHHFVIFKKNDDYLYLLQGFYQIYNLSEWLNNEEVMRPHWKIDDFFDAMTELLNSQTQENRMMEILRELFCPSYLITNQTKIEIFENWFKPWLPVTLRKVKYVNYNFTKKLSSKEKTFEDFIDSENRYFL